MTDDNPGVIAPPPLIALVPLAVGLLLDWIAPVHVLDTVLTFPPRAVIGIVLVLAGAALALAAVHCFKLAATNVAPGSRRDILRSEASITFCATPCMPD